MGTIPNLSKEKKDIIYRTKQRMQKEHRNPFNQSKIGSFIDHAKNYIKSDESIYPKFCLDFDSFLNEMNNGLMDGFRRYYYDNYLSKSAIENIMSPLAKESQCEMKDVMTFAENVMFYETLTGMYWELNMCSMINYEFPNLDCKKASERIDARGIDLVIFKRGTTEIVALLQIKPVSYLNDILKGKDTLMFNIEELVVQNKKFLIGNKIDTVYYIWYGGQFEHDWIRSKNKSVSAVKVDNPKLLVGSQYAVELRNLLNQYL